MKRLGTLLSIAVSLVAATAGYVLLMRYESAPGRAAAAPVAWPGGAEVSLASDRPTLIFLAHPRCTCTRASLDQLAELAARKPAAINLYILLLGSGVLSQGPEMAAMRKRCGRIQGARCVEDTGGVLARRFGAYTSGQALLYGSDGHLLYAGGLTAGRGVEAPGDGMPSLAAAIAGKPVTTVPALAPVFGCELRDPTNKRTEGR